MSGPTLPASKEKVFAVTAVIKYHLLVGEFRANSEKEAEKLAEESAAFQRISDRAPGGVYELKIQELP